MNEKKPIFIVGSPRSGTSIITLALIRGLQIKGHNEGHFLNLLLRLDNTIDKFYKNKDDLYLSELSLLNKIDKETVKESIHKLFKNKVEMVYDDDVWIDKTADLAMTIKIPILLRMWPKSRFIFMKRRPVENMKSRIKKFPNVDFETACLQWSNIMKTWYDIRKIIPENQFIEIDQRDVALNPNKVAEKLSKLLKLSEGDKKNILEFFKNNRPEFSGGDETMVANIEGIDWSKENKEFFKKTCGPIAEKFNYALDDRYYIEEKND